MDIWDWVHSTTERLREGDAEQQRLARLIRELPSATCDDEHERVDMLVPEAVALARSLDEPWIELFLRHWNLQSRVLHRCLARPEELREAVDLLEFANRPTTQKCPQSVCVTQDLACCYSRADGPGYVNERLAVAQETLARIDPSWPCFDCISAEYFSALMDDARAEEALRFVEGQAAKRAEWGIFEPGSNMIHNRVDALLTVGRAQHALEVLEGMRDPERLGESYAMHHRLIRVKVLLALGRIAEAKAEHPPVEAVIDTASFYDDWVLGLVGLIRADRVENDAAIGELLLGLQQRLEQHGSRWDAAELAATGGELARDRGAREIARLQIAECRRLLGLLRRPQRMLERLEALERSLAELPEPKLDPASLDPDVIERRLHGEGEPELPREQALELVLAAQRVHPREVSLVIEEAKLLRELGRADRARQRLESSFEAALDDGISSEGPPIDRLVVELLRAAFEEPQTDAFDRLLERIGIVEDPRGREAEPGTIASQLSSPGAVPYIHRLRAESLRRRGDLAAAERAYRALLEAELAGTWAHLRLAELAWERRDWPMVLAELDAALPELEPGSSDWQRIAVATLLGRWDRVRESMARLELPPLDEPNNPDAPADAPILADLGLARCEFHESDGRKLRYWIRRTSPCGGRVIELAFPDDPQHYGDEVVYEAVDLDAEDQDEHRPCFPLLAVVQPGKWRSFLVRGFDPGEEAFAAFDGALAEGGFVVERITAPGRIGRDLRAIEEDGIEPDDAPEVPTLALLVGAREDADLEQLRVAIERATSTWRLPLFCPDLDAALGDDEGWATALRRAALMGC